MYNWIIYLLLLIYYYFCFRFNSDLLINICIACASVTLTTIWLHSRKNITNNITKTLFYNPLIPSNCTCKVFFNIKCQQDNCSTKNTREIIHYLQNAKKSIDISLFCISNIPITNAIINAHSRGIFIRIIISNGILKYSNEIKKFHDTGISIRFQQDSLNGHMHNKFAVIDSTWLINGSMNWTHQATYLNWENVIITNSQDLVNEYSKGFEQMWVNMIKYE